MGITCVIRYEIDPFQREAFREYAAHWGLATVIQAIVPDDRGDAESVVGKR